MTGIPLTEKEIEETRKMFDSFDNLVYTKKEVKKCMDSCVGRESTNTRAGHLNYYNPLNKKPAIQSWPDNCVKRGRPECNKACKEYQNCKPWIKGEMEK